MTLSLYASDMDYLTWHTQYKKDALQHESKSIDSGDGKVSTKVVTG